MNENTLPLGIMRQAMMKLDGFITDIRECVEDDDISPADKEQFEIIAELAGNIQAVLTNMAMQEIGEEDFLNEQPELDEIDPFPGSETKLVD